MKDTAMGEKPVVDVEFLRDAGLEVLDFTGIGSCTIANCTVCEKISAEDRMPNGNVELLPDDDLLEKKVLDFTGDVDGGGIKMSMYGSYVEKPPMELVPMALTRGAARALGYGAAKYAPNNWRRGMRWGEVFGALKRHLDAWNEEDDNDKESGLNHLDHAAACLSFLMHMVAHEAYFKMDDRP